MDDIGYMTMALELAAKGRGFTSPNPMVGAVVVAADGRVVGKGFHEAAGKPHAEIGALEDAGAAAAGATLYVTLEPCNHQGRTPPCTEAIRSAGIRQVVMAMTDPNPDVRGGGRAYLEHHGVAVRTGVCEAEARKLNEAFVTYVTTKRPFVVVKCAATLDGRIATRTGDSRWVSGPASRRFVHELRHAMDGILVGSGTATADDPELTVRLEGRPTKDPVRFVLDTRLTLPVESRLLHLDSEADSVVICGFSVSKGRIARIEATGARVLQTETEHGRIALEPLMDRLGALGITSLLIEGGATIIGSAIRDNIVDKLYIFYAPKILGGDDGVPICRGRGPEAMSGAVPVGRISVHRFEDDILIEGYLD